MFFWLHWKLSLQQFESVQQWWDVGKIQIQQFCKQYTLNTFRNTAKLIKDLELEIDELQTLSDSTHDPSFSKNITEKKCFSRSAWNSKTRSIGKITLPESK